MKLLRDILISLLLIVFMIFSAVGIMNYFPSLGDGRKGASILGRFSTKIQDTGHEVIRVWSSGLLNLWVAVLLACIVVCVITFMIWRRKEHIEIKMGDGKVVILDSAIKKYVRTALNDIPEISPRHIGIRKQRGGLFVDVRGYVRTRENLPELQARIVDRIRRALSQEMGITQVSDVRVCIEDFESRPRKPEPLPVRTPVAAPQYVAPAAPAPEVVSPVAEDVARVAVASDEASAQESVVPVVEEPDSRRSGFMSRWRKDKVEVSSAAPVGAEEPTEPPPAPAPVIEPEPATDVPVPPVEAIPAEKTPEGSQGDKPSSDGPATA